MSKNISKTLLFLVIAVLLFSFSFCHAEEVKEATVTSAQNVETTGEVISSKKSEETEETSRLHEGDLYLFGTDIVMDKLVDGNAFIFGNNVTITGQVNGNLFVCANTLKFDNNPDTPDYKCYIRYSIFACANSIYYNAACNDLYVAANNLEATYDSYVIRDVKAAVTDANFKAAVGRDFDLTCGKVVFGEGEDIAVVYGNLRYSSPTEALIPEGMVEDVATQVTYNQIQENEEEKITSIEDIIIKLLTLIVTVVVIYTLSKLCTPKYVQKITTTKLAPLSLLKYFGIGLLGCFIACVVFFLLLFTAIGWKLAMIVALLFMLAIILSIPFFAAAITGALQRLLKSKHTAIFYLILILVSVLLIAITYIPFVGGFISFIITFVALGMFFHSFLPRPVLPEEKKEVAEVKEQPVKELEEKIKKEELATEKKKETKKVNNEINEVKPEEKKKTKKNKEEDK